VRHPQPSGQLPTFTPEQRRILPVLLIPAFVSLLAVSSVNVILPAIAASVPTSTGGLQLVVSGYSLVFGVLLVPAGRAGDVMGRGRLFVAGLVLFGLGSLAAGVAPSILALNLARVLSDGEQIRVPRIGEVLPDPAPQPGAAVTPGTGTAPGKPGAGSASGTVNINTASASDLEKLPGIGPALAQRIVEYRDSHGPFASVDALTDVPGIGKAKLEALREQATV